MLRLATKDDFSIIKKIWKASFSDSESYIDFYLTNRYENSYIVLYTVNNETIGMIHLLPCKLSPDVKAMYWYAAAILPSKRGKGYFFQFATTLRQELQKLGFFSVCLPAPHLEGLYERIGLKTPYYSQEIDYTGNESDVKLSMKQATADDYLDLFRKTGDTLWNHFAIEYAIAENEFSDGRSFCFEYENQKYVGLAVKQEDGFLIDSTNLTHNDMKLFQNSLLKALNCKTIRLKGNVMDPDQRSISGLTDFPTVGEDARLTFTLA